MASLLRSSRPAGALKALLRPASARPPKYHHHHHHHHHHHDARRASAPALAPPPAAPSSIPRTATMRAAAAGFHTSAARGDNVRRASGGGRGSQLDSLDVLGSTPVPSTSVDVCMSSGFKLNSGARVVDGSGVVLVGGEAFEWRPWLASSSPSSSSSAAAPAATAPRLVNPKGQWDIPAAALGLLAVVWPRPDLLILGVGPEIRPISPELRKAISALGMRVDVLDTHNAAAQFNLLVRERGVDDVAAALIPIGWKEGVGAGTMEDEPDLTHD